MTYTVFSPLVYLSIKLQNYKDRESSGKAQKIPHCPFNKKFDDLILKGSGILNKTLAPKKEHKSFWSPVRQFIFGSFISIMTIIATIAGVFLVVDLTQQNDEKQEKISALKLLELAESDVLATGFIIKDFEDRQSKADGNADSIISTWAESGITLPYPIIFTNVITDNRILMNMSTSSLHTIYSLGKELDRDRNIIMYTAASDAIKLFHYGKYKSNIEQLYFILNEEVKYQKGESSEEQVAKAYKDLAVRMSGLPKEEFERQLEE